MSSARRVACVTLVLTAACGRQPLDEMLGENAWDASFQTGADARVGAESDVQDATTWGPDGSSFDDGALPDVSDADAMPLPRDGGRPRRDGGPGDGGLPPFDGGPRMDGGAFDGGRPMMDGGMRNDAGQRLCTRDQDCGRGGGFNVFCDPTQGICVECYADEQCREPGAVCDVAGGNVCRESCTNGGCFMGQVCDPVSDLCVDCLTSDDCGTGEVCDLSSHECRGCSQDLDCARAVNRPFCQVAEGECVGCLNDQSCGPGQVCEPVAKECVSPTSRGLCEPCSSDDECGGPNDLCIGLRAGPTGFLDRACAVDCTNSPCPQGFDCITVRTSFRQCRPSYPMQTPTCTAFRNLGANCTYSPTDLDSGCGVPNLQDARCIQHSGNFGVCGTWCNSDSDCPQVFLCTDTSSTSSSEDEHKVCSAP